MRVLVTGAEGFLGANLCKELVERGHEVTGASLNRSGLTSLDALEVKCRIEYGDVTDADFVDRVITSSEPEWVFHLAAVSIVRVAQAAPALTLRTNILGTINVLEACSKLPWGKRVLIASSDKAYGDHGGKPYTENMPLKPTGAYEVSKTCADHIGLLYGATVVRCANVYGAGDLNWSRLVPNSCRLALSGQAPQIYGDAAEAKREWLYIDDAVKAYILLAESGSPGAYNVGSGEQYSPIDVADIITKHAVCMVPEWIEKKHAFYEIPVQVLDCNKIRMLGWEADCNIHTGLELTVDWYKDYLCASC